MFANSCFHDALNRRRNLTPHVILSFVNEYLVNVLISLSGLVYTINFPGWVTTPLFIVRPSADFGSCSLTAARAIKTTYTSFALKAKKVSHGSKFKHCLLCKH